MQYGHKRRFRLAVTAVALLAAAACGEDLRGSLNELLDDAESEVQEAFRMYAREVQDLYAVRDELPQCGTRMFRTVMPERENFDSDEDYYTAAENCRRRQILGEQANEVSRLLGGSASQWIEMIQRQREAMEPMTEAELVNIGAGVRELYGKWRIEAAEAAAERRRERVENTVRVFMENVREQNESR